MQVILLENIKSLGKIGDIVKVNRGYARNYLIKLEKALNASKENIKIVNNKKEQLDRKDLEFKKEAKKVFEKLNKKKFSTQKLVTENNELYGSVKPTEIANIINEKLGSPITINTSEKKDISEKTQDRWHDISKAKEILSWIPSTSISDGLVETLNWYNVNRKILGVN